MKVIRDIQEHNVIPGPGMKATKIIIDASTVTTISANSNKYYNR